jgi:hypothetical protein
MTSFHSGTAVPAPLVSADYLRDSLGRNQTYPVTCHIGAYDGEAYRFHSHANNPQQVGVAYRVASFTLTARPDQAQFGHPGHHLTCTFQTDGRWQVTIGDGIPPETTAALRQLAEEIVVELMEQNDELKDEVAREIKKKKDDDDRTNRKLRKMGFKTPQSSSQVK